MFSKNTHESKPSSTQTQMKPLSFVIHVSNVDSFIKYIDKKPGIVLRGSCNEAKRVSISINDINLLLTLEKDDNVLSFRELFGSPSSLFESQMLINCKKYSGVQVVNPKSPRMK